MIGHLGQWGAATTDECSGWRAYSPYCIGVRAYEAYTASSRPTPTDYQRTANVRQEAQATDSLRHGNVETAYTAITPGGAYSFDLPPTATPSSPPVVMGAPEEGNGPPLRTLLIAGSAVLAVLLLGGLVARRRRR